MEFVVLLNCIALGYRIQKVTGDTETPNLTYVIEPILIDTITGWKNNRNASLYNTILQHHHHH